MSEQKTDRNKRILKAWRKGVTVYKLAKEHDLSWPRVKRIIMEQQARESV